MLGFVCFVSYIFIEHISRRGRGWKNKTCQPEGVFHKGKKLLSLIFWDRAAYKPSFSVLYLVKFHAASYNIRLCL